MTQLICMSGQFYIDDNIAGRDFAQARKDKFFTRYSKLEVVFILHI